MPEHFRDRALSHGYHRRTAGHGFNHDQSKGLRPIDGKEQSQRFPQKPAFFGFPDLAHEFNQRMGEERFDLVLEIIEIEPVHFRGDPQRHPRPDRDSDGQVGSLFGRDPAQESQVAPRFRMEGV